jgi:predicted RNase H-like nuclease (RuvC/YqgF family)
MKEIITQSFPVVNKLDAINIVSDTFGQFFGYLKEAQMYKYETKKLKEQSKHILKQMDNEFEIAIKNIDKEFKKYKENNKLIIKKLDSFNKELDSYHKRLDKAYDKLFESDGNLENKKFILNIIQDLEEKLTEIRKHYNFSNINQLLLK